MTSNYSVHVVSEIKPFDAYPESLLQFAYACCVIFMILGIPGNLVTIAALGSCKKYRNATAIFIISLHISNLIFCCLVLPLTAVNYAKKCWTFGKTVCQVYALMKFGLIANTHLTVVAITINRYIMVCHPYMYPRFYKKRNIIISLISTWATGFVLFLPSFLEIWGQFDVHPKDGICTMIKDRNNRCPKTFFVSLAFAGPYLTIILCYGRIWWTRRKITQNYCKHKAIDTQRPMITSLSDSSILDNGYVSQSPTVSGSPVDNDISKFNYHMIFTRKIGKISFYSKRKSGPPVPTRKDKKLGTMILALLISFAISHLPLMITRLSTSKRDPYALTFGNLLEYSSAFLSPIVYVIMSNEYRQAYKILFDNINNNIMKGFRCLSIMMNNII